MYDFITQFDPRLKPKKQLGPSGTIVFEVEMENRAHILKMANKYSRWQVGHLCAERKILNLAKGISGLTHLVHVYDMPLYLEEDDFSYTNCVLKEYFPGDSLLDLNGRIQTTRLQQKLESTMRSLHSLGAVRLDMRHHNVFLSPDKSDVCFIDVGYGVFPDEVSTSEYKAHKMKDFKNLESCFS